MRADFVGGIILFFVHITYYIILFSMENQALILDIIKYMKQTGKPPKATFGTNETSVGGFLWLSLRILRLYFVNPFSFLKSESF